MAATLELAISAIRSGRKEEGRQLLNLLIQENPNNDKAWLWMSSVVDTDEQRARCLYHVLAIDPNSQIARKGLQVLGIVVSDSRPVKIPRDSQPINIPKPSSPAERRPFLIDPQTITGELPFKPVSAPFAQPVAASPSILAMDVEAAADESTEPAAQAQESPSRPVQSQQPEQAQHPSEPVPAQPNPQPQQPRPPSEPVPAARTAQTQKMPEPAAAQTGQAQPPSEPVQPNNVQQAPASQPVAQQPAQTQSPSEPVRPHESHGVPPQPGQAQHSSEPVPVVQPNNNVGAAPQPQNPGGQWGAQSQNPQPVNADAQFPYQASQTGGQMAATPQAPPRETRPSQPVPVTYPQPGMGQQYNQQAYYPAPSQMPANHSDPTMGMPSYQGLQPQPMPPHSNTTMGMPYQGGQAQHPSEPVPAIHSNNTVGMGQHGQMPQGGYNPAFHSNSTMMMGMQEVEAQARMPASQGQPGNAYRPAQNTQADDDEDEGVNILAVIIFGTLSVTALGGLGMLVLLVFTTPA